MRRELFGNKWVKRTTAFGLAGVMVLSFTACKKVDPKEAVVASFKSVTAADIKYPIEEIFGAEALAENVKKENSEAGVSLRLENSADSTINTFAGSGFGMVAKNDIANKKGLVELSLQYGGNDLAEASMHYDEANLELQIPKLSDKVFSLNYAEDLEGQINNSPYLGQIMTQSGMNLNGIGDYMDYVQNLYSSENTMFDIQALWSRYKEGSQAVNDLKAAMVVKAAGNKEWTVDGKLEKCTAYDVVLPKDAIISFVEVSSKFFLEDETIKKDVVDYLKQMYNLQTSMNGSNQSPEQMQQDAWTQVQNEINQLVESMKTGISDVTMQVYVDKKGRLAAIDATAVLTDDQGATADTTLHAELKGGAYLTQNVDAVLTLKDSQDEIKVALLKQGVDDEKQLTCDVSIDMSLNADVINLIYNGSYAKDTKDYHLELSATLPQNQGQFGASVTGGIENFEKGKSMDLFMDEIIIKSNGQSLATLSGRYYIKPLEGEITALTGEKMDILATSEADWQTTLMDMYNAGMGILQAIQQ